MRSYLFFVLPVLFFVMNSCITNKTDNIAAMATESYVESNITYLNIDSTELKLDVFMPGKQLGEAPWIKTTGKPKPTLLYIHGGGWVNLDRTIRTLEIMPYVAKGWCVVNIDYRLIQQAPFPACIADCRNALNWIYENASKYEFDTTKIVVSGESAGGHLSLMTGMLDNDNVIKNDLHPIHRKLKVAAIVNWYGVSNMHDILIHFKSNNFNQKLLGDMSKMDYLCKLCSPINYVRADQPPVFSIHGDEDPVVPIQHSINLHKKLDSTGVKNQLLVIKGKKHGNFSGEEQSFIFNHIWKFLDELGIK